MRAVCVRGFRDLERRVWVAEGEVVETTPERFERINSAGYGKLLTEIANGTLERNSGPQTTDYASLTVAQLRGICAERGIEVPSRARKAEIVAMLEA